ncbi:MAG: Phosphomevalonate kinase [Labilithrix sp.]|nr:Phosphomevalonate kinase [Labilithrix sp.]
MRTFAPGKLVLTGAYAVLEGAPAIAVAVSRGAFADASRASLAPTPEVRAALGESVTAPEVDASTMFAGDRKLGLGASAAILVASLAAREAEAGADLALSVVRDRIFAAARDAHARAQSGGSGIDVAASVHGGAIRYVMGEPVKRVALPRGLRLRTFACRNSARTSELRAEIDRLARTNPTAHRACMTELVIIAHDAARAIDDGDGPAFVTALRRTARGLARLGDAAGVGIVPSGFDELEALADRDEAAFCVSGAGGGDVAVYVGRLEPSASFLERAHALGLFALGVAIDDQGMRLAPAATAFAAATQQDLHDTRSTNPRTP